MAPFFNILDDMSQRPFGCIFIGLFNYSNDCIAYGMELVFCKYHFNLVFLKNWWIRKMPPKWVRLRSPRQRCKILIHFGIGHNVPF